jgi:hypothetical protein
MNLRKSVLLYIKSKKLKKRNGNFIKVFKRINHELKKRKNSCSSTLSSSSLDCSRSNIKFSKTNSELSSKSLEDIDFKNYQFLGQKTYHFSHYKIPDFLNDKKSEENQKIHCQSKLNDFCLYNKLAQGKPKIIILLTI